MKLLKPAKILSFIAVVGLCTYYSVKLQAYASKEIQLYKRQLAAAYIEADLDVRDLTIDLKTKQVKTASKMNIEEMKKAMWVLKTQNEQLTLSLETIKSALEYHEE